ncbi:hypothetical protein ILYODFUR_034777 [Ilyodon furcidens]|uniref:Uncharacterized protein n=1 Tax=Ilyodon furcidens TaxID=33524 RepID=A0ABV0U084_9TELE
MSNASSREHWSATGNSPSSREKMASRRCFSSKGREAPALPTPVGRAGELRGQGQGSVIRTEAALADDLQVIAHDVAGITSRAKADSADASHCSSSRNQCS